MATCVNKGTVAAEILTKYGKFWLSFFSWVIVFYGPNNQSIQRKYSTAEYNSCL